MGRAGLWSPYYASHRHQRYRHLLIIIPLHVKDIFMLRRLVVFGNYLPHKSGQTAAHSRQFPHSIHAARARVGKYLQLLTRSRRSRFVLSSILLLPDPPTILHRDSRRCGECAPREVIHREKGCPVDIPKSWKMMCTCTLNVRINNRIHLLYHDLRREIWLK